MNYIDNIIQTTIDSFDLTYCLIVNILTYIIIKFIEEVNKNKEIKTWIKKLIMIFSIFSTGVLYYIIDKDAKLILNSAILAPVSWSWIFKPICNKLGIDYYKKQNNKEN